MMAKITCPAFHHTGITDARRLPRELRCSNCKACRHVEAGHGETIVSMAAIEDWLAGARKPTA
jgi:hypothetical protein